MLRFSKQGRVPLYSDRFSPVISVHPISRDLSVLPQSWSICSNPLYVSCLQSFMFRFSKQGRVPLYLINISPVIIEFSKVRDFRVLPHCSNICRNKSLFRVLLQVSCRVWSRFETMLTFISEINSFLLFIIKEDREGRDKIPFNPVDVKSLVFKVVFSFPSWNTRISGCFFTRYSTPSSLTPSASNPGNVKMELIYLGNITKQIRCFKRR